MKMRPIISDTQNVEILLCNSKSNKCLIAFSSNDPGTKFKFEFANVLNNLKIKRFFEKIIFVRDPNRIFYINGINNNINTVDKLLKYLNLVIGNNRVYTIGYSSGGYMALLLSLFANNVDRVISLGGVMNILDWHGVNCDYNFSDLKIVKSASPEQKRYFNLLPHLKKTNNIYAFYAGNSNADAAIYNKIPPSSNIQVQVFNTNHHGKYCYHFDYKYLLTCSDNHISNVFKKGRGKYVSPAHFSIMLEGLFLFAINSIARLFRSGFRRLRHRHLL